MIYQKDIEDWITFLQIISTGSWFMILLTAVTVGVLIWIFERGNCDIPETKVRGIIEGMWVSFAGFFLSGNKRLKKSATRILMITYWAVALMFTALFIASVSEAYRSRFLKISGPD
jgi:hypothetical protein